MAINFTDFSRAPIQASPFDTLFENVLKGYKMQQEPGKMKQESEQRELANKLKSLEVEQSPQKFELEKRYKEALIKKANAAMSGVGKDSGPKLNGRVANEEAIWNLEHPKGEQLTPELQAEHIKRLREAADKSNASTAKNSALAQALDLRKQYQEGDKEYGEITDYIHKLGSRGGGTTITQTPDGGFQVSIGGDSDKKVNMQGLPKLGVGDVYLYDEEGKPFAIGKKLSVAEEKEESGRGFMNNLFPFLNEATSYYTGENSNLRFSDDIANYTSDPKAKSRIDNYFAALKLIPAQTVKENATLGGANTNQNLNRLKDTIDNSEVFGFLKSGSKYILPPGYAEESAKIFNQKLNEATKAGDENIPAFKIRRFDRSQMKKARTAPKILGSANGITRIEYNGKKFKIPLHLVENFMKNPPK